MILPCLDIGLSFKVTADANGVIQFANAPSGNYAWTLEAEGFQPDAGSIVLEPGLTKTLEKILATATIKYSWSVTPTTIVDKYDMALSVAFKTDVPAPIVVIDPTVITIDVPSHVDAFGQFTVTNLGLVSAFNVDLQPKSPDGEVIITLPFTTIPELKPGQSVIVPFKISHGGNGPHCHQAVLAASFDFTCALNTLITGKCEPLTINIGTVGLGGCTGPAMVSISADPGTAFALLPVAVGGGAALVTLAPTLGMSLAATLIMTGALVQPSLATCKESDDCDRKYTSPVLSFDPNLGPYYNVQCGYLCPPPDPRACGMDQVFSSAAQPTQSAIDARCPLKMKRANLQCPYP